MSGGLYDDVLADPVGVITAAAAAVDSSVPHGEISGIVARCCVQRGRPPTVGQSLKDHPEVLRTGRPPAPLAAAPLLLALREAAAGEVAPHCGGCER